MAPENHKRDARERTLTTADFVDALKHVVRPNSAGMHILQFHYGQPERITTPEAVSAEMKYKNPNGANLPYSGLGRLVGKRLDWIPEHPLNVLVHFVDPKREHRCYWEMRGRVAAALKILGWVAKSPQKKRPPSIPKKPKFYEGDPDVIKMTKYERNRKARRACLAHYDAWCIICGFNFKAAYGPAAEGFMHVHHMQMIKEKGKKHKVDPIRDLQPVCPNCHSVIHIKLQPYTIQEVKEMVAANRPPGWLDPPEVREARLRQPDDHFSRTTPKRSHVNGGHGAAKNNEVPK